MNIEVLSNKNQLEGLGRMAYLKHFCKSSSGEQLDAAIPAETLPGLVAFTVTELTELPTA